MSQKIMRKHMIFYGRVQGVGFRYYACAAADSLGVTGWVRNLYDGTVEMEAQGTYEQIYRLIQTVSRQRFVSIENIDSREIPLEEHEHSFRERG